MPQFHRDADEIKTLVAAIIYLSTFHPQVILLSVTQGFELSVLV